MGMRYVKAYPLNGEPYVKDDPLGLEERARTRPFEPTTFAIKVSPLDRVSERHRSEVRRWNDEGKDWEGVSLKPDWNRIDDEKRRKAFEAAKHAGAVESVKDFEKPRARGTEGKV